MPFNLSNLLRTETDTEKEIRLENEVKKLEDQAIHAEIVFDLQKRIVSARKRIAATREKGGGIGGGGSGIIDLLQRNKILVGIVAVIGLILLIAKACG